MTSSQSSLSTRLQVVKIPMYPFQLNPKKLNAKSFRNCCLSIIGKNIWNMEDFEKSGQGRISSLLAPLVFSYPRLNHRAWLSAPTNYLIRRRKGLNRLGHFIIRRGRHRIPGIRQIGLNFSLKVLDLIRLADIQLYVWHTNREIMYIQLSHLS